MRGRAEGEVSLCSRACHWLDKANYIRVALMQVHGSTVARNAERYISTLGGVRVQSRYRVRAPVAAAVTGTRLDL